MDKLQHPGPLNLQGNLSENWRKWKQCFELYLIPSGINEKDDTVKSATLLHVAGEDALEIYNTFTWEEEGDDKKTDKIMDKLAAYCNPRKMSLGRDTFLTPGTNNLMSQLTSMLQTLE